MTARHIAPQEWFTAAQLAERVLPGLPTTKVGVLAMATREGWLTRTSDDGFPLARARKGRGGGTEYHLALLPSAAQVALASQAAPREQAERPDRDSVWMRFERLPSSMKDEAQRRLDVIAEIESLIRAGLGKEKALGLVVGQARRIAVAAREPVPYCESTVRGWFARINGVHPSDRLAYLAPDYAGRTAKAEIPMEALDLYFGDFLRLSKPTHAACYRRLARLAGAKGWTMPSAKTLQRRVDTEIPADVQLFMREGQNALAHAYPHMDRQRAGIGPLQIINLDGHTCDNIVLWPDGSESRPYMLGVQDIATSMILAVRFDQSLNAALVRLALSDVFRDYGLPETALMDNGRENLAQEITGSFKRLRVKHQAAEPWGLLRSLGIKPLFAMPRWGQSKPIERAFRDFADEMAKHPAFEGSYVGKDTVSKPENHGLRAIPIAEYEATMRQEIKHYNAQTGRSAPHLNKGSFAGAYAALIERMPPRRATPEQLRIALLASEPVTMNAVDGAVRILDHRYWSPELAALKRQRVLVRFDPLDLSRPIYVYSLDNRFLCEAGRTGVGSFISHDDAMAQTRAVRRNSKRVKEASAELVRLDAVRVAAAYGALPPPETPAAPENSKIVRPAFGAARTAEQAAQADFTSDWDKGVALLSGR